MTVKKTKSCSKCTEEKPATTAYFYRDSLNAAGLSSWCRECKKLANRVKFNPPNIDESVKRECSVCKKSYPATTRFFQRCKRSPLGVRALCRWCARDKSADYIARTGNAASHRWNRSHKAEIATYDKLRRLRLGTVRRSLGDVQRYAYFNK